LEYGRLAAPTRCLSAKPRIAAANVAKRVSS